LLPIELAILDVCTTRALSGIPECHGFLIASLVKGAQNSKLLTAYGTLYRALSRLEKAGFLTSRWEDMSALANESRPRRRLYRVTAAGSEALADSRSVNAEPGNIMKVVLIPKRGLT
jgi:PadR family transcriptional regulator, regulatory protein PadR